MEWRGLILTALFGNLLFPESPPFPLSSRPERTWISYFALLATTTCAVFFKKTA